MRKLKDKHIHQKERQDASAWSSEMKEETNHCLILYRNLTYSSWPVLQNASMRRKTLPCNEEEEEALLYFIIIYNLASTHYPTPPLSFSFPNLMAAHGVGVAQSKHALKLMIATRKCYQYNTNIWSLELCNHIIYWHLSKICLRKEANKSWCCTGHPI